MGTRKQGNARRSTQARETVRLEVQSCHCPALAHQLRLTEAERKLEREQAALSRQEAGERRSGVAGPWGLRKAGSRGSRDSACDVHYCSQGPQPLCLAWGSAHRLATD